MTTTDSRFFDAPILAAYRYASRPFDLQLKLTRLEQGETLSQVVDRAALSALMQASVPELTRRSISIDGTASRMSWRRSSMVNSGVFFGLTTIATTSRSNQNARFRHTPTS